MRRGACVGEKEDSFVVDKHPTIIGQSVRNVEAYTYIHPKHERVHFAFLVVSDPRKGT